MSTSIRVADEVWIATALLHRRYPDRDDFAVREIVQQAAAMKIAGPGPLRPGVQIHASQHCVANKPPNPGSYRMLLETARGRRRLFRPGDPCHPQRAGKHIPREGDIPSAYGELLDWYRNEYVGGRDADGDKGGDPPDPILSLRGSGADVWADEGADSYVDRLRKWYVSVAARLTVVTTAIRWIRSSLRTVWARASGRPRPPTAM